AGAGRTVRCRRTRTTRCPIRPGTPVPAVPVGPWTGSGGGHRARGARWAPSRGQGASRVAGDGSDAVEVASHEGVERTLAELRVGRAQPAGQGPAVDRSFGEQGEDVGQPGDEAATVELPQRVQVVAVRGDRAQEPTT